MDNNMFDQIDFGPINDYLKDDDVTDISYSNGGQVWVKTLSKGIFRVDRPDINNALMEKLAFQCANVMGKAFNAAHPFLDAEGAELRLNFIHDSIAKNGIGVVIRKTPAKIRLEKDKILQDKYISLEIHDFLVKCVEGHANIIVCGETGSGKTEFVKYLGSKIKENEKIITVEDTLELHLDRIYPTRDIVAMKTNNIASYSDVLVACMRQNPKWILLSEVRSAEAVMAIRNAISSGHYILSTIHADKAESIPNRMYSLLETNQDIDQFLKSIYRYVQLGVYIRGYQDKVTHSFVREIAGVTEFYVDENNNAKFNNIYLKGVDGKISKKNPTKYLLDYLSAQGVILDPYCICPPSPFEDASEGNQKTITNSNNQVIQNNQVKPVQIMSKPMINQTIQNPQIQRNVQPTINNMPLANGKFNNMQNMAGNQNSPLRPNNNENVEILF